MQADGSIREIDVALPRASWIRANAGDSFRVSHGSLDGSRLYSSAVVPGGGSSAALVSFTWRPDEPADQYTNQASPASSATVTGAWSGPYAVARAGFIDAVDWQGGVPQYAACVLGLIVSRPGLAPLNVNGTAIYGTRLMSVALARSIAVYKGYSVNVMLSCGGAAFTVSLTTATPRQAIVRFDVITGPAAARTVVASGGEPGAPAATAVAAA